MAYQRLEAVAAELERRYPGWHVWFVPHALDGGADWCASAGPLIQAASPGELAHQIEAMNRRAAELESDLGEAEEAVKALRLVSEAPGDLGDTPA